MKILEIERIDDGEIFSLNENFNLDNIYVIDEQNVLDKSQTFTIHQHKEKWPNNLHQGFTSEILLGRLSGFFKIKKYA